MKRIPAVRVTALAAALAVAGTLSNGIAFAGAPGETEVTETTATTTTVVEEKPAKPFSPSINVGPGIGYANQSDGDDFGWAIHVLARIFKYGGLQLEYWSLGNKDSTGVSGAGGAFDGLYVGVAPMFPIADTGLTLYGQVGGAFSDPGNDVAGGGGLLYNVPIELFNENNVDLLLQADYKYFNIERRNEDGQHLLTFGFMVGFHKTK